MSPQTFADAIRAYCQAMGGSISSWGRTEAHNRKVGGVPGSAHRFWVGADVIYDALPAVDPATEYAARLGLKLIREGDHDHLQPLTWRAG